MVLEGFDLSISSIVGISIISLSVVTVLIGTVMLLRERGLKRLLFLLGSVELGYIFMAIGIAMMSPDTPFGLYSLKGGIFHFINASIFCKCLIYRLPRWAHNGFEKSYSNISFNSVIYLL